MMLGQKQVLIFIQIGKLFFDKHTIFRSIDYGEDPADKSKQHRPSKKEKQTEQISILSKVKE